MLLEVNSAKYLEAYTVFLTFNNGFEAPADLRDTIFHDSRMIFHPLRQPSYFKQFMIKYNSMCWDNEADFAPEFLYDLAHQQAHQNISDVRQAA